MLRSKDLSEDQARLAQSADGFVLATQHVVPPAAEPPQGNADDERVDEVGQPPLPASTGGTLCLSSSNGPLQTSRVKLY